MSTKKKRIEKLRRNPLDATFEDVRTVYEEAGWMKRHRGGGGTHEVFVSPDGTRHVSVPKDNRKVKPRYVKEMFELLDLKGDDDSDD